MCDYYIISNLNAVKKKTEKLSSSLISLFIIIQRSNPDIIVMDMYEPLPHRQPSSYSFSFFAQADRLKKGRG